MSIIKEQFDVIIKEYDNIKKDRDLFKYEEDHFNNRIKNVLFRGIDSPILDVNELRGDKNHCKMTKSSPRPHYFERDGFHSIF